MSFDRARVSTAAGDLAGRSVQQPRSNFLCLLHDDGASRVMALPCHTRTHLRKGQIANHSTAAKYHEFTPGGQTIKLHSKAYRLDHGAEALLAAGAAARRHLAL